MAKPEWGTKRQCQSCGAKYYDFGRSPIVCPACGTTFDPEAILKARRPRPGAAPKKERVVPIPPEAAPEAAEDEVEEAVVEEAEAEVVEGEEAAEEAELAEEEDDVMEDTSELGEDDEDVEDIVEDGESDEER